GRTTNDKGGVDLGRLLTGAVPIQLSVGYYVVPQFQLGFSAAMGPLVVAATDDGPCGAALNRACDGWDLHLTVEAEVHLLPGRVVDPWIGAGFGYEQLHLR